MSPRPLPRLALRPLVVLALAALASAGGVRIVGSPQLDAFPTIQAAVDVAVDGDTLLVGTGTYPAFEIDGKSISVVALPGALVEIEGTVVVRNTAADGVVVVTGVSATGAVVDVDSDPGLYLSGNAGHVRFQSCVFRGGDGAMESYPGGNGGPGVVLWVSPRVAFKDCELLGGDGFSQGQLCYDCTGGDGGAGVQSGSDVALYDCVVRGGNGGDTGLYGGEGGPGFRQTAGTVFASGSSFTGGDGGDADDFIAAFGGDGGDGLVIESAAAARLLDNLYVGGAGGIAYVFPMYNGEPGVGLANNGGTVAQYPFPSRRFTAEVLHPGQTTTTITVEGELGDRVFLVWSPEPDFRFSTHMTGTRLVPRPFLLPVMPQGVIGASGTLVLQQSLPDVATPDASAFVQGLVVSASGRTVLGSPLHFTILDREGLPDCNGNQESDYVDVIEGASPDCDSNVTPDECDPDCNGNLVPDGCDLLTGTSLDCNGNLVPDECDIASGTSEDCNSNGVPDECDIASGTSLDLNNNNVPDECDGTMTWHVDASAPTGGDGSAAFPFQTITEGVAPSVDGDTILVHDGLYTGPGNREVDLGGRMIVVQSENGSLACTIDCEGLGRAFRTPYGQEGATIQGFTIENGLGIATVDAGGAIMSSSGGVTIQDCRIFDCSASTGGGIYSGGPVTIEGCLIVNCHATGQLWVLGGGGISLALGVALPHGVTALLRENVIIGCSALEGGGIYAVGSRGFVISHCTLTDNWATTRGGGLWAYSVVTHPLDEGFFLDDSRFIRNSAEEGGGIFITQSRTHAKITSCSFVDNEATVQGGGLFMWSNFNPFQGDIDVVNTIFWDDAAPAGPEIAVSGVMELDVSYCDVAGGQALVTTTGPNAIVNWGAGNIDLDPQFSSQHLTLDLTSPCIDAGDNAAIQPDRADIDDDGNTTERVPLDVTRSTRQVEVPTVPNTGNGSAPIVDIGALERQR